MKLHKEINHEYITFLTTKTVDWHFQDDVPFFFHVGVSFYAISVPYFTRLEPIYFCLYICRMTQNPNFTIALTNLAVFGHEMIKWPNLVKQLSHFS